LRGIGLADREGGDLRLRSLTLAVNTLPGRQDRVPGCSEGKDEAGRAPGKKQGRHLNL